MYKESVKKNSRYTMSKFVCVVFVLILILNCMSLQIKAEGNTNGDIKDSEYNPKIYHSTLFKLSSDGFGHSKFW